MSPTESPAALRLTFAYDGSDLWLESEVRLDMPAPVSDPLEHEAEAGFWSELRDSDNTPLYRQVIQNPIRYDAEVYSDESDPPIQRQPLDNVSGSFDLVVPDLAEAQTIALFSSPPGPEALGEPATELGVFELHGTGEPNS